MDVLVSMRGLYTPYAVRVKCPALSSTLALVPLPVSPPERYTEGIMGSQPRQEDLTWL